MDYNLINLELERKIKAELSDLLETDIIRKIMKQGKIDPHQNHFRAIHQGHSFKITDDLLPNLHEISENVKKVLDFKEPLDFYVTNSPDINASALPKFEDDESHLIVLNSALIEKFDEDELKFVIGHEIGHLISKNAEFKRIVMFIFPNVERIPLIFKNKLKLWNQLSEMTADRYGYIASPNFEKCITNFFKLSSGLSRDAEMINCDAYMSMIDAEIQKFAETPMVSPVSHPVNPVRVKALQHFSQSRLYQQIKSGETLEQDEELNAKIQELSVLLIKLKSSELEVHRAHFMASAGLMMAMADKQITNDEVEFIIDVLSQLEVFPRSFLDSILASEKLHEIFVGSAQEIIKLNPSERFEMFGYMINIALRDREIKPEEIQFLYDVGKDLLGFSQKEIAQQIGNVIQQTFLPKLFKN